MAANFLGTNICGESDRRNGGRFPMSEVKLNLIDAEHILIGTVHGSMAEACVAALSAEPETIAELDAALARYVKPVDERGAFDSFRSGTEIDTDPWDAGVVIIDLAVRAVAAESSYSHPQPEGRIFYHDGTQSTDVTVLYRVPQEWKFFNSLIEYEAFHQRHRMEYQAHPRLDARNVLYGRALLEFIATNVRQTSVCREPANYDGLISTGSPTNNEVVAGQQSEGKEDPTSWEDDPIKEAIAKEVSAIHAQWLMTPRDDLRGQSPREVLLARREFIDFDLHTRSLQWSLQGEGPPCLAQQSNAYRFAGFGTHECVVYYDLVRHLLWSALTSQCFGSGDLSPQISTPAMTDAERNGDPIEVERLEQIKANWLEDPLADFSGRTPANIIEAERRRLPIALSKREMIIDDDCYTCVMMANDPDMGPAFWHLDGSHMDDDFAFSDFLTREEWEAENRRRDEFDKEFDRKWEERQQRLARGEQVNDELDLDSVDSLNAESTTFERPDDDDESRTVVQ